MMMHMMVQVPPEMLPNDKEWRGKVKGHGGIVYHEV
jgi:hypothetical protein